MGFCRNDKTGDGERRKEQPFGSLKYPD